MTEKEIFIEKQKKELRNLQLMSFYFVKPLKIVKLHR